MDTESAPVPPGAFDTPAKPFYETDPGIFIEAGGDGDDGGGGIDPCDPNNGVCASPDCVVAVCAWSPCDACYNPCSDATYYSTYPCERGDPTVCPCGTTPGDTSCIAVY